MTDGKPAVNLEWLLKFLQTELFTHGALPFLLLFVVMFCSAVLFSADVNSFVQLTENETRNARLGLVIGAIALLCYGIILGASKARHYLIKRTETKVLVERAKLEREALLENEKRLQETKQLEFERFKATTLQELVGLSPEEKSLLSQAIQSDSRTIVTGMTFPASHSLSQKGLLIPPTGTFSQMNGFPFTVPVFIWEHLKANPSLLTKSNTSSKKLVKRA